MNVLIILPARNEENTITTVLEKIHNLYPDLDVLVVDDASTDLTSSIVQSRPRVSLVRLPVWLGYGGALQTGYKYAIRNGYDAVIQLDADGQHDPASIEHLRAHLQEADVVVGSRFLRPGYQMPRIRRLGCLVLSFLAKQLTGIQVTDPTSGFQALTAKALEIAIQDHYPLDYPDVDVLILMHRYHLKVKEIPVMMYPARQKVGMHEGLQVWYYAIKMLLSVLVMTLRKP